jgi:carbon storage regulator
MLVLSRKLGEKIHIGADIVVTVVEVRGNHVRLAVEAPDDVRILRQELVGGWFDTEHAKPKNDLLTAGS